MIIESKLQSWYKSWFSNDTEMSDEDIMKMYSVWKRDMYIVVNFFNLPATSHTIISAFEELDEIIKENK